MSTFFSKLFAIFLFKIVKSAVFALCCEILIAEVRLRFNLVRACRSAISESRCASTEPKSSLWKLRCASEIIKKNWAFCAALLLVEKIVALSCVALLI